jgi:two-component system NtrC family response regulator
MPTILIVDDDAALRDSLAETVHDLGYQAQLAASGREALGILASNEIEGVLLDIRMPSGMDGIEVLRRIRAQKNGPPVVVLTAFASAENTIEAMRIGAFDHLTKPIGRQELRELLARMLARPAAVLPDVLSDHAAGTLIGLSEPIRRVQKTIGLPPTAMPQCSSWGRPAPARSWSRAPCTSMAGESTSHSSR